MSKSKTLQKSNQTTMSENMENTTTTDVKATTPVIETTTPVVDSTSPAVETKPPAVETKPVEAVKTQPKNNVLPNQCSIVENAKLNGTTEQKAFITYIEQYELNMRPGIPVKPINGAQHQYILWKTLSELLEKTPNGEFKATWDLVLGIFYMYENGVFADRYAYRFAEYWGHDDSELSALQRLINIIKLTANRKNRALGLKQVDLQRSLAIGFSEEARSKLIRYYVG